MILVRLAQPYHFTPEANTPKSLLCLECPYSIKPTLSRRVRMAVNYGGELSPVFLDPVDAPEPPLVHFYHPDLLIVVAGRVPLAPVITSVFSDRARYSFKPSKAISELSEPDTTVLKPLTLKGFY